ncbi:MAG: type 1 glutamine amidotransferase [Methylotenera sp.]|nr:type 1 glutamine amidotransferase [Oligoflexia bacterium]
MNVLIIDNNMDETSWGSPDLRRYATALQGATVTVRRGPHQDLPSNLRKFDRVIVSGSRASCMELSPWAADVDMLIREAITTAKPLLGVCYGHQALNRVVGGVDILRRGETAEFGWTKIEKVASAPLLEGLPNTFYSFSAHFEEVGSLPAGMKHLARSLDCEVQACQYENLPIYGIQFHPERDLVQAAITFAERKKTGTPKVLLHSKDGPKLYDPKIGELIFRNFLST